VFNPEFVHSVLHARPHQRLRWHYFVLWQMIGVELWHELFVDPPTPAATGTPRPVTAKEV
jgi:hypothetical protein